MSVENLSIKMPLELVNQFTMLKGYKINIQKLNVLLYNNDAPLETEIWGPGTAAPTCNSSTLGGVSQGQEFETSLTNMVKPHLY